MRLLENLGRQSLQMLEALGRFWLLAARAAAGTPGELARSRGRGRLLEQCYRVGAQSVPVVMLTGLFVGMVLIVQSFDQFASANLSDQLGAIINATVISELGPVLAGVMLAGRVGGSITAEIGTMNVTDQVPALRSMGLDPVRLLVTPRLVACMLVTPLLTLYADLLGALGAWLVFGPIYGGDSEDYWAAAREGVQRWDLGSGVFKAIFFGAAIALVASYKGLTCRPGAQGVGRACTEAFVVTFIALLSIDLVLNFGLSGLYRYWYGFRTFM